MEISHQERLNYDPAGPNSHRHGSACSPARRSESHPPALRISPTRRSEFHPPAVRISPTRRSEFHPPTGQNFTHQSVRISPSHWSKLLFFELVLVYAQKRACALAHSHGTLVAVAAYVFNVEQTPSIIMPATTCKRTIR